MGKIAVRQLFICIGIFISVFIGIITLIGVASPYFDPRAYRIIPFIGLILPAFSISSVICSIYLIIHKKKVLFILMLAISIIGYIGSGYQWPYRFGKNTPSDNLKIRVMTLNAGVFTKINDEFVIDEIAQFAQQEDIDIFCIQEYPENIEVEDSMIRAFHFLPYHIITDIKKKTMRVAVFSKFPLTESNQLLFRDSRNSALYTDVKINNQTVRLMCAHLQTTNLNQTKGKVSWTDISSIRHPLFQMYNNVKLRAEQADIIRSEIDETNYPVIVCADLNDPPSSFTYRRISENLNDGFRDCGKGIGYTYRGLFNLLRIDYVFYSDQFKGVKYQSPDQSWSDHNPVIMDLVLK